MTVNWVLPSGGGLEEEEADLLYRTPFKDEWYWLPEWERSVANTDQLVYNASTGTGSHLYTYNTDRQLILRLLGGAGNPGTCSAALNSVKGVAALPAIDGFLRVQQSVVAQFCFGLPIISTAGMSYHCTLTRNGTVPYDIIDVYYDQTSSPNWKFSVQVAGVGIVDVASSIPVVATKQFIRIHCTAGVGIVASVSYDGETWTTIYEHTSTLPTGAMAMKAYVENKAINAASIMEILCLSSSQAWRT